MIINNNNISIKVDEIYYVMYIINPSQAWAHL